MSAADDLKQAAHRAVKASSNPVAPLVAMVGPARARQILFAKVNADRIAGNLTADEAAAELAELSRLVDQFGHHHAGEA
jgi:hypothetical protein